ncbi:MAG: branched-chain amino acid ABC transporter permease [Candidatus Hodarchaeota archaeon]
MYETLTPILINGIVLGCLYAMMGLGLSLVWGTLDLVNFAHGEMYMLGAYVAWIMGNYLNLNPFFSLIVTLPVLFLFAIVMERFLIKPLRTKEMLVAAEWSPLLFTFGIAIFLQNFIQQVMGPVFKLNEALIPGISTILGTPVLNQRILVVVIAVVLFMSLHLFLKYTKRGMAMRAVAQNKELALTLGLDVEKTYNIIFGIGTTAAAIAGVAISSIYVINPHMGATPVLKSFVVSVLGGLGSLPGALLGGVCLGLAESIGSVYIASEYTYAIGFIIMILLLIFRPRGLLGKK